MRPGTGNCQRLPRNMPRPPWPSVRMIPKFCRHSQSPNGGRASRSLPSSTWRQALSLNPAHLKSSTTLALVQWSMNQDAAAARTHARESLAEFSKPRGSHACDGTILSHHGEDKGSRSTFIASCSSPIRKAARALLGVGQAATGLGQAGGGRANARPDSRPFLTGRFERLTPLPVPERRAGRRYRGAPAADGPRSPTTWRCRSRLVDFYLETGKLAEAGECAETSAGSTTAGIQTPLNNKPGCM